MSGRRYGGLWDLYTEQQAQARPSQLRVFFATQLLGLSGVCQRCSFENLS